MPPVDTLLAFLAAMPGPAIRFAAAVADRIAASGRAALRANPAGGALRVGLGLRLAADRA
jgi:hypothetical protein